MGNLYGIWLNLNKAVTQKYYYPVYREEKGKYEIVLCKLTQLFVSSFIHSIGIVLDQLVLKSPALFYNEMKSSLSQHRKTDDK